MRLNPRKTFLEKVFSPKQSLTHANGESEQPMICSSANNRQELVLQTENVKGSTRGKEAIGMRLRLIGGVVVVMFVTTIGVGQGLKFQMQASADLNGDGKSDEITLTSLARLGGESLHSYGQRLECHR